MTLAAPPPAAAVRRRRLHYFSGFDPRGAAHYHRLCRDEAAKAQPHGGVLEVGRREKIDGTMSRWTVDWRPEPGSPDLVRTEHVFMGWDDLVRARWTRRFTALAAESVATYKYLFGQVGAARVRRMYPPVFKAGILPLALGVVPLVLVALLAMAGGIWAAVAGACLAAAVWALGLRAGALWLLRIFAFFMRAATGHTDGLQQRARDWVQAVVAQQMADPVDEVLLVGHSVGAVVMVDTVAMLLADPRWSALQAGRPTALLTLGQSFPAVALAPGATALRQTLGKLCQSRALCWWDVTARIDPLCFFNLHPLAGTDEAGQPMHWPVLHNARFMPMYEPRAWARIRANKLQAHFLYLLTPQRPGNFSPADVLYGPRTLAAVMAAKGAAPA